MGGRDREKGGGGGGEERQLLSCACRCMIRNGLLGTH